jgi:hypothetical protein
MSQEQDQSSRSNALLGTMFVHPAFDYVFIGGALSLVAIAVVSLYPGLLPFFTAEDFRYFILFSNSAHFAASTWQAQNSGTSRWVRNFACDLP